MEELAVFLFYNCNILTIDKNETIAEAMGIFKNKILTIGTKLEVKSEILQFIEDLKKKTNEKINIVEKDLNGASVVPGFIDVHLHPLMCIYFKTQLKLSGIKGYSDLEKILKKEDQIRQSGEWIVGLELIEDLFEDPAERHFPSKYDLDPICPNRPVVIFRYDGHICCMNSAALEITGINSSNVKELTPDDGEIKLNAKGEPTGILTEGAMSLALEYISIPSSAKINQASESFSEELASFGITTCGVIIQLGEVGIAGKAGTM